MRRGRPILYELLSSRGSVRSAVPSDGSQTEHSEDIASEESHESLQWLSAGSSLRIPVGYIFLGIAGVILLVAAIYVIGFTRGKSDEDIARQQEESALSENERIASELSESNASLGNIPSGTSPGVQQPGGRGNTVKAGYEQNPGMTPILSDPRVAGTNYFILIHTTKENALKVAEFCRKNGLEAHAVRANNGPFKVFVFPGYLAEDRNSSAVQALKRKIEEVQTRWSANYPRDAFSGYYQERFTD